MAEIDRLNGISGAFEFDFVKREAIPQPVMKFVIYLYAARLSLLDTVPVLDRLGVDRCRSTAHNWVQKVDLKPSGGKVPDIFVLSAFSHADPKTAELWLLVDVSGRLRVPKNGRQIMT